MPHYMVALISWGAVFFKESALAEAERSCLRIVGPSAHTFSSFRRSISQESLAYKMEAPHLNSSESACLEQL